MKNTTELKKELSTLLVSLLESAIYAPSGSAEGQGCRVREAVLKPLVAELKEHGIIIEDGQAIFEIVITASLAYDSVVGGDGWLQTPKQIGTMTRIMNIAIELSDGGPCPISKPEIPPTPLAKVDLNGYSEEYKPLSLNENAMRELEKGVTDAIHDIDRCVKVINELTRLNETKGAESVYLYFCKIREEIDAQKEHHREAVRSAVHNAKRSSAPNENEYDTTAGIPVDQWNFLQRKALRKLEEDLARAGVDTPENTGFNIRLLNTIANESGLQVARKWVEQVKSVLAKYSKSLAT